MQPADITIVKSMKNPPSGVKLVMAAVCVMKGIQPEKIVDPVGTGQKVGHVVAFTAAQISVRKIKIKIESSVPTGRAV